VGILEARDNDAKAVMDAQTFRDLVTKPDGSADAEKFFELWPSIRVLARCTPTHKFEIVKRLQVNPFPPHTLTLTNTHNTREHHYI
jgi:magnesium-transporting ATPase (P-type)